MLQQAVDFRQESEALHVLLRDLGPEGFERETLFKSWTVNDVIAHLHLFNHAAGLSLSDEAGFLVLREKVIAGLQRPNGMRGLANDWLEGLTGPPLLDAWWTLTLDVSEAFAAADPKRRLKWFGPEMSVLSSITARLMEVWAHGQEIYDLLGRERVNHERIRNIAHLGVKTFGWTFFNRGLPVPDRAPHVHLIAPSGDEWQWNEPDPQNAVSGKAVEFCQVVTQVRNIADTSLRISGDTAERWMAIAQCFAGPAEDPPLPGTRFVQGR